MRHYVLLHATGGCMLLALATTSEPTTGLDLVVPDTAEYIWGVVGLVLLALIIAVVVWVFRALARASNGNEVRDLQQRVRTLEERSNTGPSE